MKKSHDVLKMLDILKMLEIVFPNEGSFRHTLSFKDGSLVLTLMADNQWNEYTFEESDLYEDVEVIVKHITSLQNNKAKIERTSDIEPHQEGV